MSIFLKKIFNWLNFLLIVTFTLIIMFLFIGQMLSSIDFTAVGSKSAYAILLLDNPAVLTPFCLVLVLMLSVYPLRYLALKEWKNGVIDIALFLLFLPAFVAFLLAYSLLALNNKSDFFINLYIPIQIIVFGILYILAYKKIMTIAHTNRTREKSKA